VHRCDDAVAARIAEAAKLVDERFDPTLSLVDLSHFDCDLEKKGPGIEENRKALGEPDAIAGGFYEGRGARVKISHVYVRDPARIPEVRALFEDVPGVGELLDEAGKREYGLDHDRSGELVLIAEPDAWFIYYWEDDDRAPDYARTVDLGREPGYDPVEPFVDPAIRLPPLVIGSRIVRRTLGLRTLLDVILRHLGVGALAVR
jgi:hypothetical protein